MLYKCEIWPDAKFGVMVKKWLIDVGVGISLPKGTSPVEENSIKTNCSPNGWVGDVWKLEKNGFISGDRRVSFIKKHFCHLRAFIEANLNLRVGWNWLYSCLNKFFFAHINIYTYISIHTYTICKRTPYRHPPCLNHRL